VETEAFVSACNNAKAKNGRLHLLGLVSNGGVHSHIDHLLGMIDGAKKLGVPHLYIHFFGDGRDTSPTSGVEFLQTVLDHVKLSAGGYGTLSTVVGRYYAMDRDKRWERIQVAYDALVGGEGEQGSAEQAVEIVSKRYENQETDEFLKPIVFNSEGRIKDEDTLIFFNFRADRMRQIVETFGVQRNFQSKYPHPNGLQISCMNQYNKDFPFPLLFPPQKHKNVLAEWLASKGLSQYHCAETEKYAHVTFFFNGGREAAFEREERCMVPSPKVPTYDHAPEMSSWGVAEKMAATLKSKKHPFVMCNFAPPDMVGHTGIYEAAVKACEATDKAIHHIEEACREAGYVLLVTSDHGNAEKMYDGKGGKHTAHTCSKVPFTSTGSRKLATEHLSGGRAPALCDVAPTVLEFLGVEKPSEMGGESLLAPL
jgi:2,3-bisphosphoglycerate-independent phosphoglycerate mutase